MLASKEISLLPQDENPNSIGARILRWSTGVGRYVMVFTELIVILAFISRFWLDRKNSDLSEILRQQKAILATTADFEQQYQLLSQKLDLVKASYDSQPDFSYYLKSLAKSTPPQISYRDINISPEPDQPLSLSAGLSSFSEDAIVEFISNLIKNPDIAKINVKNIEKKDKSNLYSLSILIIFNQTNGKN
jgi:hypothetical protein